MLAISGVRSSSATSVQQLLCEEGFEDVSSKVGIRGGLQVRAEAEGSSNGSHADQTTYAGFLGPERNGLEGRVAGAVKEEDHGTPYCWKYGVSGGRFGKTPNVTLTQARSAVRRQVKESDGGNRSGTNRINNVAHQGQHCGGLRAQPLFRWHFRRSTPETKFSLWMGESHETRFG